MAMRNGKLLKSLIDWHVQEGTDGIVIVGTTGESPTVDVDEHVSLIAAAVEYCAGRVPVIAGTGGNSTREAVELTKFAAKAGANYCLSVVPYYNKPTQEGLYRGSYINRAIPYNPYQHISKQFLSLIDAL